MKITCFYNYSMFKNKMSSKQSSDFDVVFLKEEFRVKCTGPFPVPKDHGKDYCKCQKEDSKPTSTTTEGNLYLHF